MLTFYEKPVDIQEERCCKLNSEMLSLVVLRYNKVAIIAVKLNICNHYVLSCFIPWHILLLTCQFTYSILNNVLLTDLFNLITYGITFTGLLGLTCIYIVGKLLTYKVAFAVEFNLYLYRRILADLQKCWSLLTHC